MKKLSVVSLLLTFAIMVGMGAASSFDIQLSTDAVSSCPCTANIIKVDVQNMYQSADTIEFELDLPADWSGFVQPDIMLGSGDSETITVYITPAKESDSGSYPVVLYVESVITGNEISRTINVEVLKCHYISIDLAETYREVCQESDEGRVFGVVLKNDGKLEETFRLSSDVGWVVFSDSSVEVAGGAEKTVQLILNPPEGLLGMQIINLVAKSETSYAQAEDGIQVDIKNCFDFEATLTPANGGVEVSDTGETGAAASETGTGETGEGETGLPSISTGGEEATPGENGGVTGAVTGAAEGDEQPWGSMIVAVIIIIVILVIIYIVVKG